MPEQELTPPKRGKTDRELDEVRARLNELEALVASLLAAAAAQPPKGKK